MNRIPAGYLKDCIRIERKDKTPDPDTGQDTEQWVLVREVRAKIEPVRATERWSARSEINEQITKITVAHHPQLSAIDSTHRIIDLVSNAIYDVQGDIDVGNYHRTLEMMCEKRLKDQ